jgi:hypothetical protein
VYRPTWSHREPFSQILWGSHSLIFQGAAYEVVSESSPTIIVVTASVKEDKRGGQGQTSSSLLHQSAMWHHSVNTHCFYTSAFFWLHVSCCLWWIAKSSNVSASIFMWILVNLLPKPLKSLVRLLENIL